MLSIFSAWLSRSGVVSGLIGFLTLGILVYRYWWKLPHPRYPPGVRGVPILGVLPFIGRSAHVKFTKWSHDKFGPIMMVRMGRDDVIILSTYDVIHEAFVKNMAAFQSRPYMHILAHVSGGYGLILPPFHSNFAQVRQFSLNTLRGFGFGRSSMETKISEIAQDLINELESLDGKPTNVKPIIGMSVANVISSIACGKSFEHTDPIFKKFVDVIFACDKKHSENKTIMMFFPFLRHFQPFKESFKHSIKLAKSIQASLLPRKDYMWKIIPDLESLIFSFIFFVYKERQLVQSLVDLFLAGTETTTTFLLWSIITLLHYPDIQALLYQELLQETGREQAFPSIGHREKLPLLEAFIQEIFRFKTLILLGGQHLTTKDVEINGHFIPKSTKVVLPNIHGCHSDPNIWKNPSKFDIYRHINKDGKFVPSKKVIPFGIGARACIGEKLARIETYVFLTNIVKRFEILSDPESKSLPPLDDGVIGLVQAPLPFKVVLKPRI
uniref:Uncharacterized protein n=1 Tax=Ciona savignyi TaxID=51511 RepID=H2YPQ6_CIOSA